MHRVWAFWHFSSKSGEPNPGNNAELSLECGVSFRRIMQIFWTRLLHLFSLFNSILVWIMSKKPFCLISLLFPFAGPRGPIDAEMLQNYFMYMRVNMSYTKHWIKNMELKNMELNLIPHYLLYSRLFLNRFCLLVVLFHYKISTSP